MKGFKKITDTGEVLFAPNFVNSKDFELLAEKYDEYTYPIDGWEWVEDYEPPTGDGTETGVISDELILLRQQNELLKQIDSYE